ncbi:MAG TPA: hypothetical protein VKW06_09225 [Candidatus Angelobacter sp.]|nr:hypothetical protein [Candidatus Angelobacter sp.]
MIWDPIEWLLLLLIVVLLLLLIWLLMRRLLPNPAPQAPWLLYDSIGFPARETLVACGKKGDLTVNGVADLRVQIELENYGICEVTLLTPNGPVLTVPGSGGAGQNPKYQTAFIVLSKGAGVSYQCKSDQDDKAYCQFRVRITVR